MAISGRVRRYHAGQSAQTLRQLLEADARFAKVQVRCSTNAKVWLDGAVASADDLALLRRLVQRAQLPTQPGIFVRVETPAPNNRAALDAGIALCYMSSAVGLARVSAGRSAESLVIDRSPPPG